MDELFKVNLELAKQKHPDKPLIEQFNIAYEYSMNDCRTDLENITTKAIGNHINGFWDVKANKKIDHTC